MAYWTYGSSFNTFHGVDDVQGYVEAETYDEALERAVIMVKANGAWPIQGIQVSCVRDEDSITGMNRYQKEKFVSTDCATKVIAQAEAKEEEEATPEELPSEEPDEPTLSAEERNPTLAKEDGE